MKQLLEMLTYQRPYASAMDEAFVNRFIRVHPHQDLGPMGNVLISVGESRTLFSSHTDTVHRVEGVNPICYDKNLEIIYQTRSNCLGADCTTGVWLMLKMIEAGIPGAYLFHRGEEKGGIGSAWMAENMPEWLQQFDRAIAFDRCSDSHVITHQSGGRCCSDRFAEHLAEQLGTLWKPNQGGIYTDTAEYTHLIPECTNLSIGYEGNHSSGEYQDTAFLAQLLEVLPKINWEKLPTIRDVTEDDYDYPSFINPRGYVTLLPKDIDTLAIHEIEELCHTDPTWAAETIDDLLNEVTYLQTLIEQAKKEYLQ